MPAIAPVSVQIADGSVHAASLRRPAQIGKAAIMPTDQAHPSRGARTDVKRQLRVCEQRPFAVERVLGLITPIQGDDVLGQFLDQFWLTQNDVTPEHHLREPELTKELPKEIGRD